MSHPHDPCREIVAELQAFLDGELDGELEQVVGFHIADCPPCLGRADFERDLRAVVATRCRDAAPSGLLDRVVARLRDTPTA